MDDSTSVPSPLEAMCKLLVTLFEGDTLAPSVTCAWLADKNRFYASAVRYLPGKKVVANATGETITEALAALAKELHQ